MTSFTDEEVLDQLGGPVTSLDPLGKLARDVRNAASELDAAQARDLVDIYYRLQEHRIALTNQARALADSGRSELVVKHFATQVQQLERQMVSVLDRFSLSTEVGRWSRSQKGIGPVLAAGLMAHIDISKVKTAGQIWRFAGLDPTVKWEKGQRRPWNAQLKVICWRIGHSFMMVSGRDGAFYGKLYRERKELEVERNEQGKFADQAAEALATRRITDSALKATYESGKLPAGRLELRARRKAVKLFLAHWFEVAYEDHYGEKPPAPYPIAHLGHAHVIPPPEG